MRKNKIFLVLAVLALVLAAVSGVPAQEISLPDKPFSGMVVKVADGDTVTVLLESPGNRKRQVRVRLYGIDAPEKSQDFGQKARQFTAGLIAGKIVTVIPVDVDRYGRVVGLVFAGSSAGGESVNAALVANGFAWVYSRYCAAGFCGLWQALEAQAREAKIGLWSHPYPLAPWKFRRKKAS